MHAAPQDICLNKNVTLSMVQLLIDAFPESLRHESNNGRMPLHLLCRNKDLDDEEGGLEILKLFIMRCPESVKHATREDGMLPLHSAAGFQSLEFCRLLIEAYPGSERITNDNGTLPFHNACARNTVATAKYFYQLYPESINVAENDGWYPIHCAIEIGERSNPAAMVEIIQFLLDCESNVVLQKFQDAFPLYWVCICIEATNGEDTAAKVENTQMLSAYLKVLQILYDAHPEAIESNDVISDVGGFCAEVQAFLNIQLTYARQARDSTLMNTRDENGQLPLHRALRDNVNLGSIKLLVKGNPSAITCADNSGTIPLHVACQHHDSASVIEYLINLDPTSLHREDLDDSTALHHACRGANHAIIALLTEKYGAVSVSKRNAHGQLPIDLLLQNKNEVEVRDEERVEYTESIYRLLRAYPMTLTHYDLRQAGSEECISQSKKKRKIDEL
jgi:ankyrin repeat protein